MKPAPLPAGGTIGVAAASSPFENSSELDRAVRWYEQRGYRVKLAPGVHARHVAIRQRTGLVTFYGPGFTSMGSSKRGDWSRERFLRALTESEPLGEVPARPDDPYIGAIGAGRATAPLVGGCLWLLRETLATPWEIELDGCILFFEDVHCPPSYVDGILTQLRNAGKLDRLAGAAIGEMYKCEEWRQPEPWLRSRSMEDVFEHHLEPLSVPIVQNLPLGHGDHLCTIPLGVTATVDADARTLTIEESALETTPERSPRAPAQAASR